VKEETAIGGESRENAAAKRSGYERLDVYQRAMALVPGVQRVITSLPSSERYALASQMRRASRSVPANIAEGYAKRQSHKEFCFYLTIAMGSANEMEVHLTVAGDLGYGEAGECVGLRNEYRILGKQLNRLIATWRSGAPRPNQQRATSNQKSVERS